MSEFIDTFVQFSNFMSRDGAFESLFCPEGMVFVHNDCPRGRGLPSSSRVPGFVLGGGIVLDEIDTCVRLLLGRYQ